MCCSLQHYFLSLVLKKNWQNFLKIALSGHYIFRKKMGQHRPRSKSSWILIPEITKRDHWLKNFLFYQNITVSYDWYFVGFFSKKVHFQLETMSLITMGNNKVPQQLSFARKFSKQLSSTNCLENQLINLEQIYMPLGASIFYTVLLQH